jgi:DNA polymerase-3 subunit delta'
MADLEVPHPREVHELQGQAAAEAAFEDARGRGRLHHAWLLTGPEGVGKATFAYRAARRLLGAPAFERNGILGADPEHPVSRQVAARSHPDILVLEREGPDGKARKVIRWTTPVAWPSSFPSRPRARHIEWPSSTPPTTSTSMPLTPS